MKNLKNQKGQSLVEFAIILPILILVVMAILEFGLILNSYLTIQNIAREGARLGIAGGTDDQIRNVIFSSSPNLTASDLTINITPSDATRSSGDTLTVSVSYNYHGITPVISSLIGNIVVLRAQTLMRVE